MVSCVFSLVYHWCIIFRVWWVFLSKKHQKQSNRTACRQGFYGNSQIEFPIRLRPCIIYLTRMHKMCHAIFIVCVIINHELCQIEIWSNIYENASTYNLKSDPLNIKKKSYANNP